MRPIEQLPMDDPRRVKRLHYGVILTRDTINVSTPSHTDEVFDIGRMRAGLMLPFPTWAALLIVRFRVWRLR